MCVSVGPANFSGTTLLACEAPGPNGQKLHLLGYQNTMVNLIPGAAKRDDDWGWADNDPGQAEVPTGNAMILPIPAVPGTMSQDNVIDTRKAKNILKDMAEAVLPRSRGVSFGVSTNGGKGVQVFDSGIYTIVLAQNAADIPNALRLVPEAKRPAMNKALFEAYAELYRDWYVALCCFNNTEAAEAAPMLWCYEPAKPELLFAPALDCHTGGVPDLNAEVSIDHTLVVSSRFMSGGTQVLYTDTLTDGMRNMLPKKVVGRKFSGRAANGDFVVRVKDLVAGDFAPKRLPPPGAQRYALSQLQSQ